MHSKRFLFLPVLCLLMVCSCKKAIDNKKQDLLLNLITDGEWVVEKYVEGSTNITGVFNGFSFQFTRDGKVVGRNQTIVETGTWTGDIANYSITSDFPNSSDPVKKLNGTWKVTDSTTETVEAETTGAQGKNILHLRKAP